MITSIDLIKKIRLETGAPMMEVKKALDDANGDEVRAKEILKEAGFERAAKRENRETSAGVVQSYIHSTFSSGATIVLETETDFVARTPEFQKLAYEIAMQVTAMKPKDKDELLSQPWIRDQSKTISDLIRENISKFGENINLADFKRFEVGNG